jgi:hypothetical protein
MKTRTITTLLLLALLISTPTFAHASDTPAKQAAKTEERMKDEKRRDEESAKDYANRVRVARFDSIWRTPRTDDIDVFQISETVSKPHKAVALLTFECATKEETQAVAGFIAKAKDLGADAVRMLGVEDPAIDRSTSCSPDDRRVYRANAIVYQSGK